MMLRDELKKQMEETLKLLQQVKLYKWWLYIWLPDWLYLNLKYCKPSAKTNDIENRLGRFAAAKFGDIFNRMPIKSVYLHMNITADIREMHTIDLKTSLHAYLNFRQNIQLVADYRDDYKWTEYHEEIENSTVYIKRSDRLIYVHTYPCQKQAQYSLTSLHPATFYLLLHRKVKDYISNLLLLKGQAFNPFNGSIVSINKVYFEMLIKYSDSIASKASITVKPFKTVVRYDLYNEEGDHLISKAAKIENDSVVNISYSECWSGYSELNRISLQNGENISAEVLQAVKNIVDNILLLF